MILHSNTAQSAHTHLQSDLQYMHSEIYDVNHTRDTLVCVGFGGFHMQFAKESGGVGSVISTCDVHYTSQAHRRYA